MTSRPQNARRPVAAAALGLTLALAALGRPTPAHAGRLSWLDEVVQQVVRDARAEGRAAAKETALLRPSSKLFVREGDEALESLAKRSDDLARLGAGRTGPGRAAKAIEEPSEALLEARFARVVRPDADTARTFKGLAPAEKRLVVEMGETAQALARRHPDDAEWMIRALGVDGMTAARVYGDDVAEVVVKEGPESLNVLRKAGRKGWDVFTNVVLPNKGKLAAAGVLGLFLANPDRFVDTAGNLTQYAVEQFAKAGVQVAGAVGAGAARGLEGAIGSTLAAYGMDSAWLRTLGMIAAGAVAVGAVLVLVGVPVRLMLRPFTWPVRALLSRVTRRSRTVEGHTKRMVAP